MPPAVSIEAERAPAAFLSRPEATFPKHQPDRQVHQHGGPRRHAAPAEYYPLFDYLRIALAVGVFVAHADRTELLPAALGNVCVQVFFALSGFLIGGILLRNTVRDLPRFYYNRTTRIWVPYLLAIGFLALGCLLKGQVWTGKLLEFFFYKLTFVYNLFGVDQLAMFKDQTPLHTAGNHFWSICVEEQFYLVAPLLLVLWPRGRVAVLVGVWLINFVYPHEFAAIALGVLLALSQRRFGDWFARRSVQAVLLALVVLAVAGTMTDVVEYATAAPLGAVCTVALLARRGRSGPLGQLLGGISYPFYLNHWVGLALRGVVEKGLGIAPLAGTLVALAGALGFSTALYLLVDRTIQARRSRWYSPRVGRWACGLAAGLALVGVLGGIAFQR